MIDCEMEFGQIGIEMQNERIKKFERTVTLEDNTKYKFTIIKIKK